MVVFCRAHHIFSGIAETVCVLLFSSALGHWVDHNPSRLHTLLLTIITNRVAVIVSSFLWFFILSSESPSYKHVLFASALVLGMVEKSSRMTNILSMERDWVPTIASSTLETPYDLTHLNTIMRRIDMLCKFLAPLAISTFISAVGSIKMAVAGVVIMSMLSCGPECWCVQRVWRQNRLLRLPKATVEVDAAGYADLDTRYRPSASSRSPFQRLRILAICLFLEIRASIRLHINSIQYYFRSAVWIPSLCVAILHGSVLTYSATFITYLLNAGFSMGTITIFKLIGSLFEISSTFIFPWAVGMCSRSRALNNPYGKEGIPKRHSSDELLSGSTKADDNEDAEEDFQHRKLESHNTDAGVVRVGLWGLCGLFLNLVHLSSPQSPRKTPKAKLTQPLDPRTPRPLPPPPHSASLIPLPENPLLLSPFPLSSHPFPTPPPPNHHPNNLPLPLPPRPLDLRPLRHPTHTDPRARLPPLQLRRHGNGRRELCEFGPLGGGGDLAPAGGF